MRKKAVSLLLAAVLALAFVPVFAEAPPMAQVTFRTDNSVVSDGSLAPGRLTASVQILSPNAPEKYIVSLNYRDADGALLDFSAGKAETVSSSGLYFTTVIRSLDIPVDLEYGATARVIIMDADTLEPVELSGGVLTRKRPETDVETGYRGIYERLYTIDGEDGSIVTQRAAVAVGDEGTLFRLKDMGEGYVAFADNSSATHRLAASDGALSRRIYGFGGTSMLWKLEPAEGGKYNIKSYDGTYLAVENGLAVLRNDPYPFGLTCVGETPFTLMTSLPGYELLTEAQKERITQICTSVGAAVFPNGTNSRSLLDIMEGKFAALYENRDSVTAEQQRDDILAAVKTDPVFAGSGVTDELLDVGLTGLPGGGADFVCAEPVDEYLYIWDLGEGYHKRIDVTYTTEDTVQTIPFYTDDPSYQNLQYSIEALARFPYAYRRFLKKVCVYPSPDGGSAFYCDGPVLTVRLAWISSVDSIARGFSHELGHSIDMSSGGNFEDNTTHWCQTDEWKAAVENDILPVSEYGSSNLYEGLAEFARLYCQSYGNRDRMTGLKQLYPNRYASFVNLMKKVGMEPLY